MFLSVIPAYGRDYKSKKELLADWNAGKDFTMCPFNGRSTYFSVRDVDSLKKEGFCVLNFRYAKQTKVFALSIA